MPGGLDEVSFSGFHHFTICLAGIVVRVHTLFTPTYWLCRNYLSEKEPDFEVTITEQDLLDEQLQTLGIIDQCKGMYLEPAVVYRKIVTKALDYDALLIHGAAISVNNSGVIFTGKSGVGKTTHIRKWIEQTPNSFVINGDKPMIRFIYNSLFVCGTPWSGKEHMDTNTMIPVDSVVFMTRSNDNQISKISFAQALPHLLGQVYLPKDMDGIDKTLKLLNQMSNNVRFFDFLSNNCKQDSYRVSHDAIMN